MTFVPGAGPSSLAHIRPSEMLSTRTRGQNYRTFPDRGELNDIRNAASSSVSRSASIRDRATPSSTTPTPSTSSVRESGQDLAQRALRRGFSPPPKYHSVDPHASIALVLQPSALPRGCKPESVDLGFKAHMALIGRMTVGGFDKVMRYLFLYKPLARAYAVLIPILMGVPSIDGGRGALNCDMRSMVFYTAANELGSVYGMAYAARSKSVFSKGKAANDKHITEKITYGKDMTEKDEIAIAFARQICSSPPQVTESSRDDLLKWSLISRGRAEREIAGVSCIASFMAKMFGVLDIEMDYMSFKYCTTHLGKLGWHAGAHLKIASIEEDMFEEANNIGAPKNHTKRLSRFFSSTLTAAKNVKEVKRESEEWMKKAKMPPRGKDSEPAMQEIIEMLFGFQPFYLCKQAHVSEDSRRAFIYAAKELLFHENELSRSLKFMVCYVIARCEEKKIDRTDGRADPPVVPLPQGVDIVTAHAAYLAHRYGAGRDALEKCIDRNFLRRSMKRYIADEKLNRPPHSCVLTKKECAALLCAHSLSTSPPDIRKEEVEFMIAGFGNPAKRRQRGGRACHQAILETIGAASFWALVQRYSAATQAFDMKGDRNAFYNICEDPARDFAEGPIGRHIGMNFVKDPSASDPGRFAHPQRSFTSPERHSFARFRERTKSFSSFKMPKVFRRGLSIS